MHNTVEGVLEHFGIKGQKWGVRRKRGSDGKVGGSSSDTISSDRKKLDKTSTKGSTSGKKSLTNKQLKDATERMNLEKQYDQLSTERAQKSKTRGEKLIEEGQKIAANVARQQVTNTANKIIGAGIDKQLKKKGLI